MRKIISVLAITGLLFGCSGDSGTSDMAANDAMPANTPPAISDVAAAMGMEGVEGVTLSGSAWRIRNSFRQTRTASPPWPERDEITNWVMTVDLANPALYGRGDTFASNLFLEPPVAGTHTLVSPAGTSSWGQQLQVWLTPWGFVAGAQRYGATSSSASMDGMDYTRFSWQSPETMTSPSGMRYTVNGYVNADNLVVRTETWVEDAFMGDMHVVHLYSDYRDFNGLMVPATIEQQRGGGGIFGISVTSAVSNPPDLVELVTPPQGGGGPAGGPPGGGATPPADLTQQLGEGAWLVNGGYVALVVEFADHLAVVEAGQSEARGEQILQQIRANISDKPIRYIINSHPHSDHTAGLVPFIREGATLVTHENNVDFLRMALSTPRTLLGEETLQPQVMGITGVGVLEDEINRLELHSVPNLHTDGMLVTVLPAQGVLFQADFTLPQPGNEANPFVKTLAGYIDDNNVQFERYLAVHAAQVPQTRADLMAALEGE